MSDQEALKSLYQLYVDRYGVRRSAFVEREIGVEAPVRSFLGDWRDEPDSYADLFGTTYSPLVVQRYQKLMRSMCGKRFEKCDDEFAGLAFLKGVIMKALTIYQADPSAPLAKFAIEFDRLDVSDIRRKLYELAQADPKYP